LVPLKPARRHRLSELDEKFMLRRAITAWFAANAVAFPAVLLVPANRPIIPANSLVLVAWF
jgi:hypothetical protein